MWVQKNKHPSHFIFCSPPPHFSSFYAHPRHIPLLGRFLDLPAWKLERKHLLHSVIRCLFFLINLNKQVPEIWLANVHAWILALIGGSLSTKIDSQTWYQFGIVPVHHALVSRDISTECSPLRLVWSRPAPTLLLQYNTVHSILTIPVMVIILGCNLSNLVCIFFFAAFGFGVLTIGLSFLATRLGALLQVWHESQLREKLY